MNIDLNQVYCSTLETIQCLEGKSVGCALTPREQQFLGNLLEATETMLDFYQLQLTSVMEAMVSNEELDGLHGEN